MLLLVELLEAPAGSPTQLKHQVPLRGDFPMNAPSGKTYIALENFHLMTNCRGTMIHHQVPNYDGSDPNGSHSSCSFQGLQWYPCSPHGRQEVEPTVTGAESKLTISSDLLSCETRQVRETSKRKGCCAGVVLTSQRHQCHKR